MAKNTQINNDDVNLMELITYVLDNKLKVVFVQIISNASVFVYYAPQKKSIIFS